MESGAFEQDYGAVRFGVQPGTRLPVEYMQTRSPSEALFSEGLIFYGFDANGMPTHDIVIPDEIHAILATSAQAVIFRAD